MIDILTIKDGGKVVDSGMNEEKALLDEINLTIREGDFTTAFGRNSTGGSALFSITAGTLRPSQGLISFKDQLITKGSEEKRARSLSRVFQDPRMGMASRMTVAEDLLLAQKKGQKWEFRLRSLKNQKEDLFRLCREVDNGLEQHLDAPAGGLSSNQCQTLSLLIVTIVAPELPLLDEYTIALDPKTAKALMQLTNQRINEQELTRLMITYRMEDTLKYGNRLIVPQKGRTVQDPSKKEKQHLTMGDLLQFFEEVVG